MLHSIDLCSVYRGVLIVEGWSERGCPTVLYDGQTVALQIPSIVERPDVAAQFGSDSAQWGFRSIALLPCSDALHLHIALDFGEGEVIDAPASKAALTRDPEFAEMLARFRKESESGGRALEIGSRARSGNTYRHLVSPKVAYVGLDIAHGPNVDVIGDAHHLSRHVDGRFDFVFSVSVFEHLLMPWMVAVEMNRVMNDGGYAYIQSHAAFPLHEVPWDFWRYSKDAWDGIFNTYTGFSVIQKGYAMRCAMAADLAVGGPIQG